MGGFFGVASKSSCAIDLFFGTDYHSHLGTRRAGLVVYDGERFNRQIHDISSSQFRPKFQDDLPKLQGNIGLGVISDYEDQPIVIRSHLGTYALVTVGVISNVEQIVERLNKQRSIHFSELSDNEINQTELIGTLINLEENFIDGITRVQEEIEGSCSLLLLTKDGIYAARDKLGRTPISIGNRGEEAYCATFESCAMLNLGYQTLRELGPGEIALIKPDGVEQVKKPENKMKICTFLWVYYGFPASCYEGVNAEDYRNKCGAIMARNDLETDVDLVAGIPDSGVASSIGYANERKIPFGRPFVKYTPTWARSFMPPNQTMRSMIAKMKLLPIEALIKGKNLVFCEDSIVRGTQLQDTVNRIYSCGAKSFHMRPCCPPLAFGCKYLSFSRSKGLKELASRKAMLALQGDMHRNIEKFIDPKSDEHQQMVEWIRKSLNLTSLKYLSLEDTLDAIGIGRENLCTYCWDGQE